MIQPHSDSFKTSDTALSAYLVSEGFGTPCIEFPNGDRAFFLFNRVPKIDRYIGDFDTARAKGNIVLFFSAYQTLLRRIRERY